MALFTKKTWLPRQVQFPGRRTLVKSDDTTEVVTVQRNEGTVTEAGDAFSAANMNDLEARIEAAINAVMSVNTFSFTPAGRVSNIAFYGNCAGGGNGSFVIMTQSFRTHDVTAGATLFNIPPSTFGWNSFKECYFAGVGLHTAGEAGESKNVCRIKSNGDVAASADIGSSWTLFQITIPCIKNS